MLGHVLKHLVLVWSDRLLEFYRHDHDRGREVGVSLASGGWMLSWVEEWAESVSAMVGLLHGEDHLIPSKS